MNTSNVMDEIVRISVEYLNRLVEDPPAEIFHYTSVEGLKGILQSSKMRATNLHFLNDISELNLALDGALILAKSRATGTEGRERAFLDALAEQIRAIKWPEIYVASFSREEDLLSQWRSYCPADGGYSIGFSGSALAEIARNEDFHLFRCRYLESEQTTTVEEWLDFALELWRSCERNGEEMDLKLLTVPIVIILISLAPLLKHFSFREECEWRMISIPFLSSSLKTEHRNTAGLLVPFREIPLQDGSTRFPVTRIRIGPRRNPDLAEVGLKTFLHSQKHKVLVERSSTPHRVL